MEYKENIDTNTQRDIENTQLDAQKDYYLFESFATQLKFLTVSREMLTNAIKLFNSKIQSDIDSFPNISFLPEIFVQEFTKFMHENFFNDSEPMKEFFATLKILISNAESFNFLVVIGIFDEISSAFENGENVLTFIEIFDLITEISENYPDAIEYFEKIDYFSSLKYWITQQGTEEHYLRFFSSNISENSTDNYILQFLQIITMTIQFDHVQNPENYIYSLSTLFSVDFSDYVKSQLENNQIIIDFILKTMMQQEYSDVCIPFITNLPGKINIDYDPFIANLMILWNEKIQPQYILQFFIELMINFETKNFVHDLIPILVEIPQYYSSLEFDSKDVCKFFIIICLLNLPKSDFGSFMTEEFQEILIEMHEVTKYQNQLYKVYLRIVTEINQDFRNKLENIAEDIADEEINEEEEDSEYQDLILQVLSN
ncbi:hypothetical protein TVAG_379110 [Trichomonas vaginalis G3]|uniref:Uncharacterized protein n=1 Tax=Trichomonas vaginalis (strain ATCC PRA-98 / G3) TaxID=412133 RepID=A2DBA2_TRIV3|nr:hypothetical protein TVAGG3_0508720 [Trichomonas vaginalis G3]EAY22432.1 hypothetical protein TVAG_379110 [Trichomonas vaginalis G3]KAI5517621.1 hypothetical protein TVAGG3_0508720 [Trichomonas vaginalis G3]|eukprot:XP_001583418.1 hypothetical protein [Trichomonas vaginalis G3]